MSMPLTMRLVLVPMMVQRPPKMAAKLRGIMSRETGMRQRRLHSSTKGTIIATTGVLLRNADRPVTGSINRIWAEATELGRPSRREPSRWMPPVSTRPAATTYSAPTVASPGLARPSRADSGVSTPVTISRVSAPTRMTSGAYRVPTSIATVPATMPTVIQASTPM